MTWSNVRRNSGVVYVWVGRLSAEGSLKVLSTSFSQHSNLQRLNLTHNIPSCGQTLSQIISSSFAREQSRGLKEDQTPGLEYLCSVSYLYICIDG